ncbi:hypothetical protein PCIT_b0462 [Pseudoalteromonas citrea]|uniref:WD40 repeat domain-containing protein n=2 Tax=Pseudoalteromonas citrea TaxID=43655 RepID=A0AAD4AEG4_9GAMM|nr:hypothetical protein [Pseudoalteromonas citrea]KAF7764457.1 hypothetical protein PCIT_b0462 [Pseudoalteromonas citrea]
MSKHWVLVFATLLLFSCTEPKKIEPSERYVLSDRLLLDGKISKDGSWALLLTERSDVLLLDIRSENELLTLDSTVLPHSVREILLSKVHGIVLVAGNNTLQVWDIERAALLGQIGVNGFDDLARVSVLALSDSGNVVAIGMTDGSLNILNLAEEKVHQTVLHQSNIAYLNFIDDDTAVVSASHDGHLRVWELVTGSERYSISFPSRVSTVALNHDNTRLFASDSLKTQLIIGARGGEVLTQFDYLSRFKWFRHALFIKGAPYLLTSSAKSELSLWHMKSGKEMFSWNVETHSMGTTVLDMVELSNTKVLTLNSEGIVEMWDISKVQFRATQE